MLRSEFNFELPRELIALYPSAERTGCRMLVMNGAEGTLEDRHFYDLKNFLRKGDLLVLNDTRVIPARLYGHKESGGKVEILIERLLGERNALAHLRASRAPGAGGRIFLKNGHILRVTGRRGELFCLESEGECALLEILRTLGHIPLPPYIDRKDEPEDRERYQTVYNRVPGAVAAPTAGLHFDQQQLEELKARGVERVFVTLHIGAGTFQPVREDDIRAHHMHSEYVNFTEEAARAVMAAHRRGGRVVAVGTTAVRVLESAAALARQRGLAEELCPFSGETEIFIYPGFKYKVTDVLITNFHLPESTLIMLVSAFAGYSFTLQAYRHAVEERYHFFSYGDCCLIFKNPRALSDLPPSAALQPGADTAAASTDAATATAAVSEQDGKTAAAARAGESLGCCVSQAAKAGR